MLASVPFLSLPSPSCHEPGTYRSLRSPRKKSQGQEVYEYFEFGQFHVHGPEPKRFNSKHAIGPIMVSDKQCSCNGAHPVTKGRTQFHMEQECGSSKTGEKRT